MEGQSRLSELSVISWMSAVEGCPRGSTVQGYSHLSWLSNHQASISIPKFLEGHAWQKLSCLKANSVDVRCPGYIRGESNTKIFKQGGWREASLWRVHNMSHFNVLRSRDFWSTHAQIKYLLCCTSMKLLGEWRIWYRAMSSPYLCWRQPSYYFINIDKEKKRTNHWSMWVSGLCWRLSSIYGNILCSVGRVTGDARPKNS